MQFFKTLQSYKPGIAFLDAPVRIEEVSILQEPYEKTVFGRIRFINQTQENIIAVIVRLTASNIAREELPLENARCIFQDILIGGAKSFSANTPQPLPSDTRYLDAVLEKAVLADGTVWIASESEKVELLPQEKIEIPEQYLRKFQEKIDGRFATVGALESYYVEDEQFWQCTCGTALGAGTTVCPRCQNERSVQKEFLSEEGIAAVIDNIAEELQQEKEQAEAARAAEEEEKARLEEKNLSELEKERQKLAEERRQLMEEKAELARQLAHEKETMTRQLTEEKEAFSRQVSGEKEALAKQLADGKETLIRRLSEEKEILKKQLASEKAELARQLAQEKERLDRQQKEQKEKEKQLEEEKQKLETAKALFAKQAAAFMKEESGQGVRSAPAAAAQAIAQGVEADRVVRRLNPETPASIPENISVVPGEEMSSFRALDRQVDAVKAWSVTETEVTSWDDTADIGVETDDISEEGHAGENEQEMNVDDDNLDEREDQNGGSGEDDASYDYPADTFDNDEEDEEEEEEDENSGSGKRKGKGNIGGTILTLLFFAAAIAAGWYGFQYYQQQVDLRSRYESATELMNAGNYDAAIEAFYALNGYKDSDVLCNRMIEEQNQQVYDEAYEAYEAGDYQHAIELWDTIKGFKNADDMVDEAANAWVMAEETEAQENDSAAITEDVVLIEETPEETPQEIPSEEQPEETVDDEIPLVEEILE